MPTNLPTELLRSFVEIVDSGSMLRDTERVFVTQSALSLQMKRPAETTGPGAKPPAVAVKATTAAPPAKGPKT